MDLGYIILAFLVLAFVAGVIVLAIQRARFNSMPTPEDALAKLKQLIDHKYSIDRYEIHNKHGIHYLVVFPKLDPKNLDISLPNEVFGFTVIKRTLRKT